MIVQYFAIYLDSLTKHEKKYLLYIFRSFVLFPEFYSLTYGILCICFIRIVCECRVDDLCIEGLKECYFLDFLGPRGFAAELSHQTSCT